MAEFLRALRLAAGVQLGLLGSHPPRPWRLDQPDPPIRQVDWPRIAIVTPVRNQADFIGATIDSVLSQSADADLEYHVQDGASTDGTTEIAAARRPALTLVSEADGGQADALNRGFARTSAGIMAYLNGDDILLPGALATVAAFFAARPDVDVVYGHRILIDAQGRKLGQWVMPAHDDTILSWYNFVPQETLFWRRRAWEAAGGHIDASFDFAVDWDLLVRLRDSGARFCRLPRFLGGFRVHDLQKTRQQFVARGRPEMERIRRRCLGRTPTKAQAVLHAIPYLARHAVSTWQLRLTGRLP